MPAPAFDLDAITIQSPCTVPWSSMHGDDVRRYCGQCRLHVHDVSKMTRDEVRALAGRPEGVGCLRIWRRPDGTLITRDCSRVRLMLERRLRALRVAAAGLLALVGLGGCRPARVADDAPAVPASDPASAPRPTMGTPMPPPPPPERPPVPGATVTTGR